MSVDVLYASAYASLAGILTDISKSSDSQVSRNALAAMLFADELRKLYLQVSSGEISQPSRLELHHQKAPTNLSRRYALLKELGLPITSLITFGKSEGLHDVDMIRLIRELAGLDLAGAQALLKTPTNEARSPEE